MKKNILLILGFIFMLILINQCKHEPELNLSNTSTKSGKCDPDSVYFVNDIKPLISSTCAKSGCHDAVTQKEGVQLTDYINIMKTGEIKPFKPNDNEIIEALEETRTRKIMPPPPNNPWTSDQINMFKKWVEQGALNNECIEKNCDTTNVKFSTDISKIIKLNCEGCHSGAAARKGVKLENYIQIKAAVDNGSLKGTIFKKSGFSQMPPAGPLDSCKQKKIEIWIKEGAKNN